MQPICAVKGNRKVGVKGVSIAGFGRVGREPSKRETGQAIKNVFEEDCGLKRRRNNINPKIHFTK